MTDIADHQILCSPRPEVSTGCVPRPKLADIRREVCERFGLTREELTDTSHRPKRVAWPRMLAAARMRRETTASLKAIANAVGWDDHTTVVHAVRRFNDPAFCVRFIQWENAQQIKRDGR
jgi:hypothetical protein